MAPRSEFLLQEQIPDTNSGRCGRRTLSGRWDVLGRMGTSGYRAEVLWLPPPRSHPTRMWGTLTHPGMEPEFSCFVAKLNLAYQKHPFLSCYMIEEKLALWRDDKIWGPCVTVATLRNAVSHAERNSQSSRGLKQWSRCYSFKNNYILRI